MLTPFVKGPLSVEELTLRLKQLVKDAFPFVSVYGEVSNLRTTNDVTYFTLKDATSKLPVVIFKGESFILRQLLSEGQSVLVEGRLDVYVVSGRYQLIAKNVRKLGFGILRHQFELLKEKLCQEGFFASESKYSIPLLPYCVGLITSPEADVLQDFIRILQRKRWKGTVLFAPALVQGNMAPKSIMQAFSLLQKQPEVELIILIRGGGSFEDLNCFNQEALIRFLAKRHKPLLTGIGHETDYTLCDFIADKRVETPTAAAEIIVNAYQSCNQQLQIISRHLHHTFTLYYQSFLQHHVLITKRLQRIQLQKVLHVCRQRYKQQVDRLRRAFLYALHDKQNILQFCTQQFKCSSFLSRINACQTQLANFCQQLQQLSQYHYAAQEQRSENFSTRLQTLSPKCQLRRGFLIPLSSDGKRLKSFDPAYSSIHAFLHASGVYRMKITAKFNETKTINHLF